MRVLHVLDHSIPMQSGYTFRTRAILREQRQMGWETFHVTSPKHVASGPGEETVDGLLFYRTRPASGAWRRIPVAREIALMGATTARLEQVARLVRPHVLHAHSPVLNALPALRVGRRLGIPVVYEVRAFWEDAAVDHGTHRENGLRYRAIHALESFALRRADHVTTICEGLKDDIVGRGIASGKVTVIPNGVDIGAFEFGGVPDAALKAELGCGDDIIIGFIGSFYAYEGLDILLAALPAVLKAMPRVRVLLVGGGPHEAVLRALARDLGVADRVIFTGRVPHDQVGRYYSIVDVFAYPRRSMRLTELVTPLKPLEAMAQGRLLVASDVGGHRELIRDGETGTLFRAGDPASLANAIIRLMQARDGWAGTRERGRRFVERERAWPSIVSRYRDVFGRLVPAQP
ncbi:MAG: TIGR04063 family PEP-CTERM/XrtA system glycosyltransferase [Casimicrobiaceae bacterium]